MPSRRSPIAASALALLILLAASGCSHEPGPTAPEPAPQLPRTGDTVQPDNDQERIRELEALARGFRSFRRSPEDTVIILWPAADQTPLQVRRQAGNAGNP